MLKKVGTDFSELLEQFKENKFTTEVLEKNLHELSEESKELRSKCEKVQYRELKLEERFEELLDFRMKKLER